MLVLIEYVPYGDLLGYLRKSRGLNDTYFKDPDSKPQTTLFAYQLMKFAWQVADGMCYLSSKKVRSSVFALLYYWCEREHDLRSRMNNLSGWKGTLIFAMTGRNALLSSELIKPVLFQPFRLLIHSYCEYHVQFLIWYFNPYSTSVKHRHRSLHKSRQKVWQMFLPANVPSILGQFFFKHLFSFQLSLIKE